MRQLRPKNIDRLRLGFSLLLVLLAVLLLSTPLLRWGVALAQGGGYTLNPFVVAGGGGQGSGGPYTEQGTIGQADAGSPNANGYTLQGGFWQGGPSGPTAVTLAAFQAGAAPGGVLITWLTAAEVDALGFTLWRRLDLPGQDWRKLNPELIQAHYGGAGGSYQYVDRDAAPGRGYSYRLEMVNLDGSSTWAGPVTLSIPMRLFLPWSSAAHAK